MSLSSITVFNNIILPLVRSLFIALQSISSNFERKHQMKNSKVLSSNKSRKKVGEQERQGQQGQQGEQGGREPVLYQRFLKYLSKRRQQKLVNGIYNYYGKNFSIEYKSKFNFLERWQERKPQYSLDDYLLEDINFAYSTFSLLVLVLNFTAIWVLSTERYFQTHIVSQQFALYNILVALKATEIVFRSVMKSKREEWRGITAKTFFEVNWKELLSLVFFVYLQVGGGDSAVQALVELYVYYLLWRSASNIYQNIKLKSFALKYENPLKIFDLLLNILIQAHIFSILMFCSSKISADNWTVAIGISHTSTYQQYLYAYYFSCTTMLTIGYGDITPQNSGEVAVVILIQITGVVSFGYLLNEMGHTLSKMRQQKEALEKDLQTIGKMAKYYGLERNLQNRAKKYIITNHKIIDQLRPDEEHHLLMKFNDQLRTQITNENSLSILKTSIFFLCHWSKSFQAEISKALEKRLLSPNQRLGEVQRIYIIKAGKVCIYMNRFNNNNKKLLRTISINPERDVSDNIYGYTSAFSNRPVHLQAVTKEITTTYSISKEHFVRSVALDKKDFEYYHEIKCKIDQSAFCEEWEAPAIKSIREHYIPSKIFLIKKNRVKLIRQTNKRILIVRNHRKKYQLINHLYVSNAKCIDEFTNQYTIGEKTLEFIAKKNNRYDAYNEPQSDQSSRQNQSSIESLSERANKVNNSKEVCVQLARIYIQTRRSSFAMQQSDNKRIIANKFQKRRDYSKFFPRNNFEHVLLRFEKQNCLQKGGVGSNSCK